MFCSECLHLCILQHNGYICYCNEPNCNKDEQCTCNNDQSSTTTSTPTSTANPDNGLKCQVCDFGVGDHMCDGESDNGKSMTCLEGEVCVYLEEGMI